MLLTSSCDSFLAILLVLANATVHMEQREKNLTRSDIRTKHGGYISITALPLCISYPIVRNKAQGQGKASKQALKEIRHINKSSENPYSAPNEHRTRINSQSTNCTSHPSLIPPSTPLAVVAAAVKIRFPIDTQTRWHAQTKHPHAEASRRAR